MMTTATAVNYPGPTVSPDHPAASDYALKASSSYEVEDIVAERRSKREALRAKLREHESRLTNMMRQTSCSHTATAAATVSLDGNSGSTSIPLTPERSVSASSVEAEAAAKRSTADLAKALEDLKLVRSKLDCVQKEKEGLEKEVTSMKHLVKVSENLKTNYVGMDERYGKQLTKNKELQTRLLAKDDETEMLRGELAKKLQRIVELEFELETHELNYTNYADELFKLGEEALEEIKGKNEHDDHHHHHHHADDGATPKKAKRLISKLLADLDDLEMRYKEEKLRSATLLEEMRMENQELLVQVQFLEQKVENLTPSSEKQDSAKMDIDIDHVVSEDDETATEKSAVQQRTIEKLHAKNSLYRKEMEKLKAELSEARRDAQADAQRAEHNATRLQNEVFALKAHVEHMEAKQKWGSKKKKDHAVEQFAAVEKRIEDNYKQVVRLQNSVEIKDRQIATLKMEVANLRKKEIAEGNIKETMYTATDSDILREESMQAKRSFESDRTKSTADSETSQFSN